MYSSAYVWAKVLNHMEDRLGTVTVSAWFDDAEVVELNEGVGKEKLSALTANIAFAGFTAPKILWMRKNEPELFAKIKKIANC